MLRRLTLNFSATCRCGARPVEIDHDLKSLREKPSRSRRERTTLGVLIFPSAPVSPPSGPASDKITATHWSCCSSHLYQVARCYECKGNDTAVFVHLTAGNYLAAVGKI